jgi:Tfp pilus assembly protein PilO
MFNSLKKPATLRESALIVVAILALCYLIFTYLYNPKKKELNTLMTEVTEINKKINGTQKLVEALKKKQSQLKNEMAMLDKEAQGKSSRIQLIKKYKAPIYHNVSELLNAIAQPEFRSSISISALKYGDPHARDGYTSTRFNLHATGQFGKMVDFLEKIESLPVLLSMDSIELSVSKTDTDLVLIKIDCTFYQLENNHV